jgi:hypothetical protein
MNDDPVSCGFSSTNSVISHQGKVFVLLYVKRVMLELPLPSNFVLCRRAYVPPNRTNKKRSVHNDDNDERGYNNWGLDPILEIWRRKGGVNHDTHNATTETTAVRTQYGLTPMTSFEVGSRQ